MSKFPRLFGVRRLNPIRGVLQVLELEHARALSPDGEHWEIQILAARPEHSWRSANQHEPVMRYFRFGVWSRTRGLSQVPVSPILDLDTLLTRADEIQLALAQALNHLPFPLADRYELWLLDADSLPVALIASARSAEAAAAHSAQAWTACGLSEHGFESCSLSRQGIPTHDGHNPRRHAYELEQQVRRRVGKPPHHAWYLHRDGGERHTLNPEHIQDPVTFPELPLTRDWNETTETELANDYLDWCAPYLLTLPDISDSTRCRLELAVARRAPELASQFRLYPRVINQGLIDTARVEARLRNGFT